MHSKLLRPTGIPECACAASLRSRVVFTSVTPPQPKLLIPVVGILCMYSIGQNYLDSCLNHADLSVATGTVGFRAWVPVISALFLCGHLDLKKFGGSCSHVAVRSLARIHVHLLLKKFQLGQGMYIHAPGGKHTVHMWYVTYMYMSKTRVCTSW